MLLSSAPVSQEGGGMEPDRVRQMADEVAQLMAERLGGLRRGQRADLATMLRRRGGALPRPLRREALALRDAATLAGAPRIARQLDQTRAARAHAALVRHLKPLGQFSRIQGRATGISAAVALGLLLLGATVIWLLVWRGYL